MLGVDGVFILLCKQPPFAAVVVSEELEERGFSDYKRGVIARQLPTSGWVTRSSDRKLLEALEQTRDEIVRALQNEPAPPVEGTPPWLIAAGVAGLLLLVWFVVGIVRVFMGSSNANPTSARHIAASSGGVAGNSSLPPTTAPGLEELKRRAEALTRPPPPARPDEKTLTHPGPGGEAHRDV